MASNHERKLYKLRIEAKTSLVKRISSFGTDKVGDTELMRYRPSLFGQDGCILPRPFLHLN